VGADEVFDDAFVAQGLDDVWFATRGCPDCDSSRARTCSRGPLRHWLCATCGQCWRLEHLLLRSADPLTCHGCATRRKSECIGQWALAFPPFGAQTTTDDFG